MKKKSGRETKSSLLSRQKIERRRQRHKLSIRLILLGISILILGGFTTYFYPKRQEIELGIGKLFAQKHQAWKVILRLDEKNPLSEKDANLIIETSQNLLGSGSQSELEKTAMAVQRLASYASIHVLKISANTAVIELKRHTPVACLEADQMRFVTAAGDAYGEIKGDLETSCPGLIIKGVFAGRKRPHLSRYGILEIDDEEKQIITEGLELHAAGKRQNLEINLVEFKPFRGFVAFLPKKNLEVALGRIPFDTKLSKLNEILIDLAQKGNDPARIELDYQGKAFIKLKKM